MEMPAYLEVIHQPHFLTNKLKWSKVDLLSAAEKATVSQPGWPIGVCLTKDEAKPRAMQFGIRAKIKKQIDDGYDYWELHEDGKFYFMRILEEELPKWKEAHELHFDTRIKRTFEALLHCRNLYSELGLDPENTVHFHINLYGLKNRILSSLNPERRRSLSDKCEEEKHEFFKVLSPKLIETDAKAITYEITKNLFELFNFFRYQKTLNDDVIDKFLKRQE